MPKHTGFTRIYHKGSWLTVPEEDCTECLQPHDQCLCVEEPWFWQGAKDKAIDRWEGEADAE